MQRVQKGHRGKPRQLVDSLAWFLRFGAFTKEVVFGRLGDKSVRALKNPIWPLAKITRVIPCDLHQRQPAANFVVVFAFYSPIMCFLRGPDL